LAKFSDELQSPTRVLSRIALLAELLSELVDVKAQWTFTLAQ
jgi:hypothetical protein